MFYCSTINVSPSDKPHDQEDLYGKYRSYGAAMKMLLDKRILLENRTYLFNDIDADKEIKFGIRW